MNHYQLEVYTPDVHIFRAFYYGYGEIVSQETVDRHNATVICTVVDYKEDRYHADYQAGRFWSGMYQAVVKEMAPIDVE